MSATPKRKPRHKLTLAVQYGVAMPDVGANAGLSNTGARYIPSARRLRAWAQAALLRNVDVTLRIVDGREGRTLNRAFRGKDYATNVLTFIYDVRPLNGDIALCAPVIAREARAQRVTAEAHYAHLVVHGMLHLQGHDHENAADAARMEKLETRILAKLGYDDPYR